MSTLRHGATPKSLNDGPEDCLPGGASGFTTIELKTNLLGSVREGELNCVATLQRSTQIILWPKARGQHSRPV